MGFWGTLGKIGGIAGAVAGAPFSGGGTLATLAPLLGAGASVAGGLLNKRAKSTDTSSGTSSSTSNINNSTQFQFDPTGMDAYNQLTPMGTSTITDYLTDPLKATYFNNQLAGSNRLLGGLAVRHKQNIGLNMAALGAAPDPMRQAQMAGQIGRSTSALQADSFLKLLMQAEAMRRGAATTALNYNPLQTGSNMTGTTTTNGTTSNTSQTNPGTSIWGDLLSLGGNALMSLPKKQSTTGTSGAPLPFMSGPMF